MDRLICFFRRLLPRHPAILCESLRLTVCAITALLLCPENLQAGLRAGPMLAHIDMREATIWLQADEPSTIRIRYTESGSENVILSSPVDANPELALTATIRLNKVEPGKLYRYEILQNGEEIGVTGEFKTQDNYHFRAPPPDFSFAAGGANYVMENLYEPPYQLLGGGYGIFDVILSSSPDFMLWTGNTAHLRRSDFTTLSGILKRFSYARAAPELSALLSSIPHYAIWGKADYGFHDDGKYASQRTLSEKAFRAFWPRPIDIPTLEGIPTRFRYADADFFMLDVRSYRDDRPNTVRTPEILGKTQIEWLRQELIRSDATFKIIVSGAPVLNPAETSKNLSFAEIEHNALLEMLRSERISGLFMISGGKYFGELTKLVHASNYNLYDLTVGPLTAGPQAAKQELNYFRVPGTTTVERQFALIRISGPEDNRQMQIQLNSMEGDELWSRTIKAKDLQPSAEIK